MLFNSFYAEVIRCPIIRALEKDTFRFDFFPIGRLIVESAILASMALGFAIWFMPIAGSMMMCLPGVILVGYAVAGFYMKRKSLQVSGEIRHGELWLGYVDLKMVGQIKSVLCVDISGYEDEWRTENGSSRIYLFIGDHAKVLPFLISSTSLGKIGKQIAEVVKCPYSCKRGLNNIPKAGIIDSFQ